MHEEHMRNVELPHVVLVAKLDRLAEDLEERGKRYEMT